MLRLFGLLSFLLAVCFVKSEMFSEEVKLREWPYKLWDFGPPCPPRHNQQLLPVNMADLNDSLNEINDYINNLMSNINESGLRPGLSVGVVYNQQTLFSEGYGTIHKNKDILPSETTVYDIGSVTKIFTSLAFYHSVQENLVSLTDPVTKFFNEENPPIFSIRNPYSPEGAKAVTLHSLASQASGLPREGYCAVYPINDDCKNLTKAAELNLRYMSQNGLLFSPFTGSHYSNFGLGLLGRSLERVWDVQYEEYMSNVIFPALGMSSLTGFNYTEEVIKNMSSGYAFGTFENGTVYQIPLPRLNHEKIGWEAPAGGMYSNRQDIMNFMKWIFGPHGNSSLLTDSYLAEYLAPGMLLPNGIELFGQGTFETMYANGYWTITKSGGMAGMTTQLTLVPELKLGVIVFCNIVSLTYSDVSAKINEILVPALQKALANVQVALPLPPNYDIYLGSYGVGNTVYLTLQETANTTRTGVLGGSNLLTGESMYIWDSDQDYNGKVAIRYSTMTDLSCISLSIMGDNAIAYFHVLPDGTPAVDMVDVGGDYYNITMLT